MVDNTMTTTETPTELTPEQLADQDRQAVYKPSLWHRGREEAKIARRHAEAYEMWLGGASYQQIADAGLYANKSNAHRALKNYIAQRSKDREDLADAARDVMLDQLDALWRPVYKRATTGDGDLQALDRCLKIAAQRAKLLHLEQTPLIDMTVGSTTTIVGSVQIDNDLRAIAGLLTDGVNNRGLELPDIPALRALIGTQASPQVVEAGS